MPVVVQIEHETFDSEVFSRCTRVPIGLQLLAPPFEEDRLFRSARVVEQELT